MLVGERDRLMYVLSAEQIDFIEAHGNYVKLHAGTNEYISRDSVKRLAAALPDSGFLRIERSLLINMRAILHAQRAPRGTYLFTLRSGSVLRSGPKYRNEILRLLPLSHRSQRSSLW